MNFLAKLNQGKSQTFSRSCGLFGGDVVGASGRRSCGRNIKPFCFSRKTRPVLKAAAPDPRIRMKSFA
jgi:hypothetical protein